MQNGYCERGAQESLESEESGLDSVLLQNPQLSSEKMFREFRIELNKGGQATNWKQFWFITATLAHTSTVKVQKEEKNKRSYSQTIVYLCKILALTD